MHERVDVELAVATGADGELQALARALNWLMYSEKDPSTVDALFFLIDPPSGNIAAAPSSNVSTTS